MGRALSGGKYPPIVDRTDETDRSAETVRGTFVDAEQCRSGLRARKLCTRGSNSAGATSGLCFPLSKK